MKDTRLGERLREETAQNEAENEEKKRRAATEAMFKDMGRRRRQEQSKLFEEREEDTPEEEMEEQRREEERRLEEERLEREREERLQKEKERKALELAILRYHKLLQIKWREEAATIEQYIVLESSLVTYGAGLEIRHVIPGYDLSQITLTHLPVDATRDDVIDLFVKQRVPRFEFSVLDITGPSRNRKATVLFNAEQAQTIATMLQGKQFRDTKLTLEVRDDAVWTTGSMEKNRPYLAVIWEEKQGITDAQQAALAVIRHHLANCNGIRMETCEILTPDSTTLGSNRVIQKVEFETWVDLERGKQVIERSRPREIPSLRSWNPNANQYSVAIPFKQYKAQKAQWTELSQTKAPREARLNFDICGREGVYIYLEGDEKVAMGALKVRLEKLAQGEMVDAASWHPSFASAEDTAAFFDSVMETTGAFVQSDTKMRLLRLYGTPDRIEKARQMIEKEVNRLLQLKTRTRLDDTSLDFFMREGLGKLQELVGEDNVDIKSTSKWSAIMIRGGEEATHHFERLLEESQARPATAGVLEIAPATACPICYDEISHPEQLGCGHIYCSGCLNHFLTTAADGKTFPIVCMGDEGACQRPIAVPFIRRFLPAHAFRRLVENAFASYLEKNPVEFRYCKTPDCRQTYRRHKGVKNVHCPSCFLMFCSACEHTHKGMTCEEYRILTDTAEQERLNNQLAAQQGYKRCPRCAILIEKTAGCNHMSCKCGVHICWKCMGVFPSNEIYNHMRSTHGDINN